MYIYICVFVWPLRLEIDPSLDLGSSDGGGPLAQNIRSVSIIYIYIYIYRERERYRYIYIYICDIIILTYASHRSPSPQRAASLNSLAYSF